MFHVFYGSYNLSLLIFFFTFSGTISVNSRRTPFTASGENEILDLEGDMYLGGLPDSRAGLILPTELWTAMLNYGYVGCIRDLFIDGRSKDIRQIAEDQNGAGIKPSCNKMPGKQCDSYPQEQRCVQRRMESLYLWLHRQRLLVPHVWEGWVSYL